MKFIFIVLMLSLFISLLFKSYKLVKYEIKNETIKSTIIENNLTRNECTALLNLMKKEKDTYLVCLSSYEN